VKVYRVLGGWIVGVLMIAGVHAAWLAIPFIGRQRAGLWACAYLEWWFHRLGATNVTVRAGEGE
jgi:hypothetical protein